MNKIDKDELFRHFSDFLKARGVQLQEGLYTKGVQKGCELLADSVNLSQEAWERARAEMERQLDQKRQVIHEKTAPKATAAQAQGASTGKTKSRRKAGKGKTASRRRPRR